MRNDYIQDIKRRVNSLESLYMELGALCFWKAKHFCKDVYTIEEMKEHKEVEEAEQYLMKLKEKYNNE